MNSNANEQDCYYAWESNGDECANEEMNSIRLNNLSTEENVWYFFHQQKNRTTEE